MKIFKEKGRGKLAWVFYYYFKALFLGWGGVGWGGFTFFLSSPLLKGAWER